MTSRTGAAVGDICQTIRRRAPSIPILLSPARVQGAGAPDDTVPAPRRLGDSAARAACGAARGGGAEVVEEQEATARDTYARLADTKWTQL